MKKGTPKKNVTIDELAVMVANGFEKMDNNFEAIDTRFDKVERDISSIKNDVQDIKLGNYSNRMDKIEDKMLVLQTGIEKHLKIKFQK